MSTAGTSAGGDLEPGKLFVGGLSWATTKESLKAYFEKFGEVTSSMIMIDQVTTKPRGFGFVTFAEPSVVNDVLQCTEEHVIDNKKVDPQPAMEKPPKPYKVFLGGLHPDTTENDITTYFNDIYGATADGRREKIVMSVDLKYDEARKVRGFGFVTFNSEAKLQDVCKHRHHTIRSKQFEAKEAVKMPPKYSRQGYTGQYSSGMCPQQTGQYPQRQQYQQQDYDAYQYGGGYGNYSNGHPSGGYGAASYTSYPQSASQQPVNSYQDQGYGTGYSASRTDATSYGQQHYSAAAYQQQGYGNTPSGNTGYGRSHGQQQQQHPGSYYSSMQ